MTKFSRDEYETIMSYDYVAKKWTAYSNIPSAISKFKNKGWKVISELFYPDGSIESCKFEAPASAVTIRNAVGTKRTISQEHKEKLLAAAKKGKANKKEGDDA